MLVVEEDKDKLEELVVNQEAVEREEELQAEQHPQLTQAEAEEEALVAELVELLY
jgi:hypothetical protein